MGEQEMGAGNKALLYGSMFKSPIIHDHLTAKSWHFAWLSTEGSTKKIL